MFTLFAHTLLENLGWIRVLHGPVSCFVFESRIKTSCNDMTFNQIWFNHYENMPCLIHWKFNHKKKKKKIETFQIKEF